MKLTRIGLDIAKRVFQVHGVDEHGLAQVKKKLSRPQVLEFFAQLPICLIGIEACGGAHYWARELSKLGHTVKLMAAQFVNPYRKSGKNDANDAEAICEAVSRPNVRFVAVKTEEQQSVLMWHRARTLLSGLLGQLRCFEERIEHYDQQINQFARQSEAARRLMAIEGIGPITSTALVATVGDARVFENGRQFSAWLGLTPRQHSSGGKNRLGQITKRGDRYLRTLLVHGSRALLRYVGRKNDAKSAWAVRVMQRRHVNVAAAARIEAFCNECRRGSATRIA